MCSSGGVVGLIARASENGGHQFRKRGETGRERERRGALPVVGRRDGLEPLLARRVPNLQFDLLAVQLDGFDFLRFLSKQREGEHAARGRQEQKQKKKKNEGGVQSRRRWC